MHATRCGQKTLLLASMSLPSAKQLSAIAMKRNWKFHSLDESPSVVVSGARTFYGGTDCAAEYASRFQLSLIEPPLDLLGRVPREFLSREVRFGSLENLSGVAGPIFIKPADPILKSFDAGVYRNISEVRGRRPIDSQTPVIVSQSVEWTGEFRCFISEDRIQAWSPYLSYGRPVWKPQSAGPIPTNLVAFCGRLFARMGSLLPPAYVVDIGVLDDGRWAVVEFNPAWCSGILGANVEGALRVVERAACSMSDVRQEDRQWVRLGCEGDNDNSTT